VGPTAGVDGCGKSRPHRDSIPNRPARSESLYRLIYPGPITTIIIIIAWNVVYIGILTVSEVVSQRDGTSIPGWYKTFFSSIKRQIELYI
jgi:hypothetical protein